MTTAKELHIEEGDVVRFKLNPHADRDLGMIAGIVGQTFNRDAQQLVWDFDFISNGMMGKCTCVIDKPTGTLYKFQRLRENGTLGDVSVPIKDNNDCIETLVLRQLKLWT